MFLTFQLLFVVTTVPETNSLLPRWSPFGDFGPHGDKNKFFGPHFFFKVPILSISGLGTRQKSVQPLSNDNHLITCDNQN